MSRVRVPFGWLGGKSMMLSKLLALMPEHIHYVEPFGGSGALLLAKSPCKGVETYNDLDSNLANFFRVLSDIKKFDEFYRIVAVAPHSREIAAECYQGWKTEQDPVQRASKWYIAMRQAFGGMMSSEKWSWGFATNSMGSPADRWLSVIKMLPEIHARLQGVQIENRDFRFVLETYDGEGYFAYIDPPYVASTRVPGAQYDCEMSDSDHKELVRILSKYKGAVMLSGYPNELYRSLEEGGWGRVDIETVCFAAGKTRGSKLRGEGSALKHAPRTECVWRNPECLKRVGFQFRL